MCRIVGCIVRDAITGLALLSFLAAPAGAQPAGAVTFELPMQRTSVAGAPDETARIVSGSASLEHWFSQERARVFYEISLDRFHTADAWDTWLHNAGAVRTFVVGNTSVDTGAALFWRANSGGWADAGFRGLNVQSTLRQALTTGSVTASYNFYLRAFADASALDQVEHYGSVRALANLQSRTTLVAAASVGWKRYDGDFVESIETAAASSAARGQGRGAAMLLRPVATYTRIGDAVSRTLWTWSARVAQSLADRTGAWVEHEQRRTDGEAPPALVWTPPLFYDDGVYDDPYAIEARTWRAGARHVFARGDELAIWTSRSARNFMGLGVLDERGAVVDERTDTLGRSGVDAAILLRSTSLVDVVLLAGYGHVRNVSNDPAETYRSHVGTLGLTLRW
jgi:hypothetical protein